MAEPMHNPTCFANHMGLMACEGRFLTRAVAAIRSGLWQPRAYNDGGDGYAAPGRHPYQVMGDGVSVIRIDGSMGKAAGKYVDASTVAARRAVRAAVADPAVGSILLVLDSPGGYVAGTAELGDEVAAAGEQKPIVAFAEDLCASAAYWVASQADKVYANAAGFVGSIGAYGVVWDTSKQAEMNGVQVHLISTGPLKGAGADGVPVTEEMLAAWRAEVDASFAMFAAAVKRGRSMSAAAFAKVSTGGMWQASEAKDLGLIDGVRSFDAVLASMPKPRRAKTN